MKKVDNETLKSLVKGALRFLEKENRLVLRRFTQKQEVFFDETLNYVNKPLKAKASASMLLDMVTNTQKIELSVKTFGDSTRRPCFLDVYCDNELVAHCGYAQIEEGAITVNLQLKNGKKRITIFLPTLSDGQIESLSIDDNASVEALYSDKKFLFLGDSITQGYVAEYPSRTYANQVVRAFDADVVNQAIGGAYFHAPDLSEINYNPTTVFVAYGTNDWAHGYELEKNATEYFAKLVKLFPNARVVCITPIWRGDVGVRGATATMPFNKVGELIENVCKKFNISVIDGSKLVDAELSNFIQDCLHPNDKGFDQYAQNLIKQLTALGI